MKTRGREAYLMGKCLKKIKKKHLIYDIFADFGYFSSGFGKKCIFLFAYNAIVNEKEVFRDDEEN